MQHIRLNVPKYAFAEDFFSGGIESGNPVFERRVTVRIVL